LGNSPQPTFSMVEICRKHPAHLPVHERHNEPVIVFLTVCSKHREPILARPDCMTVILDAWREAKSWSVGRLCNHARPRAPFLCARCVSNGAADAMGAVLEEHRFQKLAASTRTANLAT